MKKTYIVPTTNVTFCEATQMIAASITGVGGNSGIQMGTDETAPTEADVKDGNFFGESIFD